MRHTRRTLLAVIEAMLMGLPVVSTAVGGIPEMLQEYPLGRTTVEQTATAIADQILDVCTPGNRLRADATTIEQVERRYSAGRMASDYRVLYSDVI